MPATQQAGNWTAMAKGLATNQESKVKALAAWASSTGEPKGWTKMAKGLTESKKDKGERNAKSNALAAWAGAVAGKEAAASELERRVDPVDGRAYTFAELSAHYVGEGYKKKTIEKYWSEECSVAKKKKKAKAKKAAKKSEDDTEPAEPVAKTSKEAPKPRRKPAAPEDVLARLANCKVVPVIKLDDAADAAPLCDALKAGGIDVAEITFRTACAEEAIRSVSQKCEGVCIGAGTVLKVEQVDAAIEAGADFIVSPGFDTAVCRRCQRRGALYLPGVVTPTEVMMVTSRFGLKALKFFPASNFGGAGTLKSFGAVFPDVKFMPTGGVTLENVNDFLKLDNVMAAGGSWLVGQKDIKNLPRITEMAKEAFEATHK